ncbi:chromosome transmission fidelity protein 18 homolog [Tribolium madens]|uniref:chromosome transmission fidelity protein 18 homolog n=1 Tax=Tribolium madens TaxID=41895 RepID=UPI001CF753EF|nr:chromosome transmission fidelity protein 18 homolog [Tribolium madens]
MDEFPNSEDEFELMYGDDLEVLQEQGDVQRTPKKSRRSLEFTPSEPTPVSNNDNSFSHDFTPLEDSVPEPNTNKRSIEELFGDIDDILYENQTNSKRYKGDHADDLALIDHIVELRKLNRERDVPEIFRKECTQSIDRTKDNLSYTVPSYPFVGVTRDDGRRVYIRCHSEQYELEDRQRIIQEINLACTLGPNEALWAEAQELILKQTTPEPEVCYQPSDKELWVDLYKPRKYFELLSDESTNRIMLRWMKLWDKVVFKRRPKIKPNKPPEKNQKFQKAPDLCTDLDEHGRPFHKVALLCGPPGLGKTTLAHMVARHAGYNVVEINASDDRSIESFKTALENATQMRSVVDQEKRPNCLIFDEIDGAPPSSIDFLVKFVQGGNTGKKKQKEKNVLKRPIICICNDVYVPALRPLRQIAFVVNFPATSNTRLAERLMEIAKWQKVNTDLGAMLALAEKSQNDIRACLSVLHFFKSQNKAVTLSDVHKTSVGQKDIQKGIFSVWQDVFLIGKKDGNSLKDRMSKILNVVNAFGDYEKIAQGVFENYPNMKFKNSSMMETCLALDWFGFCDIINKSIYSTQNYNLAGYLPFACVVWHFAFGSRTWQKLQYPSAGYEAKTKQNRQKAIINELIRGMQPAIRSYVQPISLILDILPLLTTIIMPSFRPIGLHLYTEEEKKALERVVSIMVDYNLGYVQERTADGKYDYKLDPNIDELVSFGPKTSLSYFNKQLIAKEIETAKMRRFASSIQDQPQRSSNAAPMPNHLQTLKAKSVSGVEMPAVVRDFFGRVVTKASSSSGKPQSKNDVWFKYKEGYSNAVRKKIKISTLK